MLVFTCIYVILSFKTYTKIFLKRNNTLPFNSNTFCKNRGKRREWDKTHGMGSHIIRENQVEKPTLSSFMPFFYAYKYGTKSRP